LPFNLPIREDVPRVKDFVVMAALYGEKAWQTADNDTRQRSGLLSRAIMEGLRGARVDSRGRVTHATVTAYVKEQVPKLAAEADLQQVPEIHSPPEGEIVFATIPEHRLPRIPWRIIAPSGLTGDLVLRDGTDETEIERHPAESATEEQPPWQPGLLPGNSYVVMHVDSGLEVKLDTSTHKNPFRFPRPA
jgi:hypothetical protein